MKKFSGLILTLLILGIALPNLVFAIDTIDSGWRLPHLISMIVDAYNSTAQLIQKKVVNVSLDNDYFVPTKTFVEFDSFCNNAEGVTCEEAIIGISTCEELQMIGFHPAYPYDGNYQLATNIDCSATNPSSPTHATSLWGMGYEAYYGGKGFDGAVGTSDDAIGLDLGLKGFKPIASSFFVGEFDGKDFVIDRLYIYRVIENNVGLFRWLHKSKIMNLGITNASIRGRTNIGAFTGLNGEDSSITNSYATGGSVYTHLNDMGGLVGTNAGLISDSYATIRVGAESLVNGNGSSRVGGLVAENTGSITNSYAEGNVTGYDNIGGLVGRSSGPITNSYATGIVIGVENIGGLVGGNGGDISLSYASGSVTGQTEVGGLAGENGGDISLSYASGETNGGSYVGGLVGNHSNGHVVSSYAKGDVNGGWRWIGGLIGRSSSYYGITDSYATGNVSGGESIGGLVGSLYDSSLVRSYAVGSVSGSSDTGGLVGSVGYLNSGIISNSYWDIDLYAGDNGLGEGKDTIAMVQEGTFKPEWVFKNDADAPWKLDTIVDPGDYYPCLSWQDDSTCPVADLKISINSCEELQKIGNDINYPIDGEYILAQDIDCSATKDGSSIWDSAGFLPIGLDPIGFSGKFDGQDHVISNLYINSSASFAGLFGVAEDTEIINVGLDNIEISGDSHYVGGLVGRLDENSSVSDSYVTGEVNGSGVVGGLVGLLDENSSISDSYVTGEVNGSGVAGGLIGLILSSDITNSYAEGTVSGSSVVGGLVGRLDYNSSITDSYATGEVNGSGVVGGLVGLILSSDITNSYAEGMVSGDRMVGGLVGRLDENSSILNSYSTGVVSGIFYTGGLVGFLGDSSITNSYAEGMVSGDKIMGGLVGFSISSNVFSSYAVGQVFGDRGVIGGLVGDLNTNSVISNSYSTGAVSGGENMVGGLVGQLAKSSYVFKSYSAGAVSGIEPLGGLATLSISDIVAPVFNSYWNIETSGQVNGCGPDYPSCSDRAEGKTVLEMLTQSAYVGFDFNTPIWKIDENNGFACLAWQEDSTCPVACGTSLVDSRDGKSYATVLIGTQCWMAENMNYGNMIGGDRDQGSNCPSVAATEKYCFNNVKENCTTDGGLYQWNQAMCGAASCNGTGEAPNDKCITPVQGICPSGWHIPSHYEWTTLERAVCSSESCVTDFPFNQSTTGWLGTNEGTVLKTGGSSNFAGLLAGYRSTNSLFNGRFAHTVFWSSFLREANAWARNLSLSSATVGRGAYNNLYGLSVRCLKD
jgi:uncharacterized protein (TIGR02145 family)